MMVHIWPPVSAVLPDVQVPPLSANPAPEVENTSGPVAEFVTGLLMMKVWLALFDPAYTSPKLLLGGVMVSDGAGVPVPRRSTAALLAALALTLTRASRRPTAEGMKRTR